MMISSRFGLPIMKSAIYRCLTSICIHPYMTPIYIYQVLGKCRKHATKLGRVLFFIKNIGTHVHISWVCVYTFDHTHINIIHTEFGDIFKIEFGDIDSVFHSIKHRLNIAVIYID